MFWPQEVDTTVSQEDMGGLHWGLHHYCGGVLVPGWLHVQVQVDDLPSHSTSPAHVWGTHLPCNLSACAQLPSNNVESVRVQISSFMVHQADRLAVNQLAA